MRTIHHRELLRAGLVESEPKKRLHAAWRRFEFPAPDHCWQISAFQYLLADARVVEDRD